MQNIITNLIEGITGLRTHKLRSLLAILGVILIWQIQRENRVWRLDILDIFRKRGENNTNT